MTTTMAWIYSDRCLLNNSISKFHKFMDFFILTKAHLLLKYEMLSCRIQMNQRSAH